MTTGKLLNLSESVSWEESKRPGLWRWGPGVQDGPGVGVALCCPRALGTLGAETPLPGPGWCGERGPVGPCSECPIFQG